MNAPPLTHYRLTFSREELVLMSHILRRQRYDRVAALLHSIDGQIAEIEREHQTLSREQDVFFDSAQDTSRG